MSSFPDSAHQTGHADLPYLGFRTRVFLSLRPRQVVPILGQPDLRCPPGGYPWTKNAYAGPIFKEPRSEKKWRIVELSRARLVLAVFWPLNRIFLWSGTDCKSAGFTPSVVRIHSCPSPNSQRLTTDSLESGAVRPLWIR